jgi:hypothetical protein
MDNSSGSTQFKHQTIRPIICGLKYLLMQLVFVSFNETRVAWWFVKISMRWVQSQHPVITKISQLDQNLIANERGVPGIS